MPETLMHNFKDKKSGASPAAPVIVILIIVALLGTGTGYLLAKNLNKTSLGGIIPGGAMQGGNNAVSKGQTFGSNDTKTFKDTAEGILKDGGIDGEGQYHLQRPGGDSQNVYMTSSLVDLSLFINKKIKVWGETQKAQTAGWLMDVGKVEVL